MGHVVKIALWGMKGSGKSALMDRLVNNTYQGSYEPTIGIDFGVLRAPDSDNEDSVEKLQFWDITGDPKYRSIVPSYMKNNKILIYCIDLSKEQTPDLIKSYQEDIDLCKQASIDSCVVLVGTKSDSVEQADDKLEAIKAQLQQVNGAIVTSAKENTNIDVLKEGLFKFPNEMLGLNVTSAHTPKDDEDNKDIKTMGSYPDSYTRMWMKDGASELLRDYCKADTVHEHRFFSTLKRILTGHWNRHHVSAVRQALKNTKSYDPTTLLEELKKQLIEKGNTLEKDGSLAKRINFIQEKSGVNVITSIAELNDEITNAQSTKKQITVEI
ncbi:DUF5617 domain-containing protein [Legionella cardiaca]|uniref:DUF5617 domain-containing protein n=1 Tax=Legionella cardiaca TaxID=1071983 RepID=A0ABY8AN66_9GAMM|nr:DUF5617 domain-containing protein [Legionella cardiaca]WED42090.1 DUF5617 domain-containing protein [Legionella cardiaca]